MKRIFLITVFLINAYLFAQVDNWQSTAHFNYKVISKGGLYGLTDANYKIVVQPIYESIDIFTSTMAIVKRNGKFGLMDYHGKEVVLPQFDGIDSFPKTPYYKVQIAEKWGLMDSLGNVFIKPDYKDFEIYDERFYLVTSSGENYWAYKGLMDHAGNIIVPLEFHCIWNLNDTLFAVHEHDVGYSSRQDIGAYDIHGNMIVYPDYQSVRVFNSKYLKVEVYIEHSDSFFLLDGQGNKLGFHYLGQCVDGLCPASKGNGYGFIDTMLNTVIPFTYSTADPFSNGIAQVKLKGKYGFINAKNEVVIPLQFYEQGKHNDDGTILFRDEDKKYLYNRTGEELCITTNNNIINQRVFHSFYQDNYDYILFIENGQLGLKTTMEDTIVPAQYDVIYNYENGTARIKKDGKMSCIDEKGNLLFPFKYEYIGDPSTGLAVAMLDGKVGYINTKGQEVVPLIYDAASNFNGAYAYVKQGDENLIIDITGQVTGKYKKKLDWDTEFYQWVKASGY